MLTTLYRASPWLAALAAALAGVLAVSGAPVAFGLLMLAGGVAAGWAAAAQPPSARTGARMLADPLPRGPGAPGFADALVEQLPASLFVVDLASRRIAAVNAHAEQEFRFRREDMVGKTVAEAFWPAIGELTEAALARSLATGAPVDHDAELPTRTRTRIISLRYFATRHADGSPHALIVLARDVTVQRQAERELSESQARFLQFAETVDDSLFVTDPQRTHFTFLSPGTFEAWGLPRGQRPAQLSDLLVNVVPQDRPILEHRVAAEMGLQAVDVTVRINHPVKGLRWLRSRTRSRATPDGGVRVFGVVSDVSEQREHELELQRARDEAEAASQAKSQFMANMSHEIRTPMNGILGMTELLLGTSLNDRQRRFAQAVYRSGESLLEIINDILDFSKIEAGRLELAPCDFTLRSVVEDTLELLAPRAHEKGLELSFREERPLPGVVRADPLRLRQVLTNLVANAIKFTESGEVVVEVQQAAEQPDERSLLLEFRVRDTGIGIEPDMLPRLFTSFTQAHGGMSRRYGGTGLGLAISRQLVELMGGRISAHSAPGQGSQFSFTLPVVSTSSDSSFIGLDGSGNAVGTDDVDGLSSLRVLVVEDHPTNRTVLENMLEAWGMRVTLADDGEQALDILRGRTALDPNFDLALVDMRMPRMDGMALARALRASGTAPRMKMILLSSLCSPDDVQAAREVGFHHFVAKPVRKTELRQAIVGVTAVRGEAPAVRPQLDADILVIEDNPVNQEVMGQMLRRLGCRVRLAASAIEGLQSLCDERFDLVMMDIQMPGMDGVEALGWFRRGSRQQRYRFVTPSHTPVIAVTANALDGDEERFLGLGFDDYLSKPFRKNQLLAMLTKRLHSAPPGVDKEPEEPPLSEVSTPRPMPPAPTVLDAQALARLRELDPTGANRLLERVMQAFEASVRRLMPQLVEAQDCADMAGVRHVVHTLKSSSASIGAIKLSQLCAEIEALVRLETRPDIAARVSQLQTEADIVLKAIKSLQEAR